MPGIDGIETEEAKTFGAYENGAPPLTPNVELRETATEVENAASEIIETVEAEKKVVSEPIAEERITPPPANEEKVQKAADRTFPHPAKEGLMAALGKEEITSYQIKKLEKLAADYSKKINDLLKLNTELASLTDEKVDFTDEIRKILDDLKKGGIEIWKDEKTTNVEKQRIVELKASISSRMDTCRTEQQIKLAEMQHSVQDLMAIFECIKAMLRDEKGFLNTVMRNSRVN